MLNEQPQKKHQSSWVKWILNTILVLLIIGGLLWWQYPNILHHIIEPHVHKQANENSIKHRGDYDSNRDKLSKFVDATGVNVNGQSFGGFNQKLEDQLGKLNGGADKKNPDLTYDYSNVKPYDETNWDTVNPKYDSRLLVGHIRIPAIHVNLPILEGLSNTNLYIGAGTMKPYQKLGQGNYALASHHMPDEYSNFSQLGALRKGNHVYMSSSNYVYDYKVDTVKEMPTNSGDVVNDVPGKKMVTLVTCTDIHATARVVVQGHFVKKESIKGDLGQRYFK